YNPEQVLARMKAKTVMLLAVLCLVALSIVLIERSKPAIPDGPVDATRPDAVADAAVADIIAAKEAQFPYAPELIPTGEFINTEPLTLAQLRGKVVLVDFWTYSCINCIRTLPYLKQWHDSYADAGLVILGVHTPEFAFEQDPENVRKAVNKFGITYPVMQDNDYRTWRAYKNQYWPRKYLVDIDGFIRYDHIGEGGYEETELAIQALLKEKVERMGEDMVVEKPIVTPPTAVERGFVATPELYFGSAFRRNAGGNSEGYPAGETVTYAAPVSREPNTHYVIGTWTITPDYMELQSEGSVLLTYTAKNVNIVASSDPAQEVQVLLDGQIVDSDDLIGDERLYAIVLTEASGTHELEIKGKKGLRMYTFTFG
ncbi:thioredoxin family protein, partial [Candidatus Woesearchaeota archaeon]|nr:thioredoxin family protein [Candidatus Woesearchaeota archaeon]